MTFHTLSAVSRRFTLNGLHRGVRGSVFVYFRVILPFRGFLSPSERGRRVRLTRPHIDDPAPVHQPASGNEDTTRCAPTLRVDYSRISIYPLMIVRGYCYLSRK